MYKNKYIFLKKQKNDSANYTDNQTFQNILKKEKIDKDKTQRTLNFIRDIEKSSFDRNNEINNQTGSGFVINNDEDSQLKMYDDNSDRLQSVNYTSLNSGNTGQSENSNLTVKSYLLENFDYIFLNSRKKRNLLNKKTDTEDSDIGLNENNQTDTLTETSGVPAIPSLSNSSYFTYFEGGNPIATVPVEDKTQDSCNIPNECVNQIENWEKQTYQTDICKKKKINKLVYIIISLSFIICLCFCVFFLTLFKND